MDIGVTGVDIHLNRKELERLHMLIHDGYALIPWTPKAKEELMELRKPICKLLDCEDWYNRYPERD